MIHWNERLWKADFWKSLTHSVTDSKSDIQIKTDHKAKWLNQNKASLLAILEDFHQLAIYFPICVCDRSVTLRSLSTSGSVQTWACRRRASGNWALIFPLAGKVFPRFVPSAQMFPLWHVVFICWTPESVSVSVLFLSRSARVMFSKPGSGNFFQCVIEGYDKCPFSISTVDMFIAVNGHLPISLLFCIMEIFLISLLWRAL